MNVNTVLKDLGIMVVDLFSDDNGYKSDINLERYEHRVEQALKALNRGEKPYKSISREEMKERFGNYDGYTDFDDVYAVDDLHEEGYAFTVAHEYLHIATGKGSEKENEVLDLTYKILRNMTESEYVDPEVRDLASAGYNYGVTHREKFYGDVSEPDSRLAFQQAADQEGQNREPIDDIVPHLWEVPLGAIDYVARFPATYIGNLLSLGSGKSRDVHQEVGISKIGKSVTKAYKRHMERVRAEERQRRQQAQQQNTQQNP